MNKLIFTAVFIIFFAESTVQAQTGATSNTAGATTAAAAQTSTTTLTPESKEAGGKAWSLSLVSQAEAEASKANYQGIKSYNTTNFVGGSYKLNKNNSVGIRQYFSFNKDGENDKTTTTMMDPAVTYTRSGVNGVFGTEPLTAMFYYFIPTAQTSYDVRSNGGIRMDLELPWTLNPKWSVSYFLSPRQSFIPNGSMIVEGEEKQIFSKTSLVHYAGLYYSFSDFIQAYSTAGFSHRWKTSDLSANERNAILAAGVNFALLGGKIMLTPGLSVESKQIANGTAVAAEQIIQEKNISYTLTSAFVF